MVPSCGSNGADRKKFGLSTMSMLFIILYTSMISALCLYCSQAGDVDSSRAPGLTSGLQGSVNVHHGALLLVPQ